MSRSIHAPWSAAASQAKLLAQYGCGPIQFRGSGNALYERHLLFDGAVDPASAGPRERYEAFAHSVRDILSQRWVRTENVDKIYAESFRDLTHLEAILGEAQEIISNALT